jgi:hypothetical protein
VLTRKIGEVTELAADRLAEEIRNPKPDAQLIKALAVGYGVGVDKMREASISVSGDLHVHQSVNVEGIDPLREYLKARAEVLSTDSHAARQSHNMLPPNASQQSAAGLAASDAQPIEVATVVTPASEPDQAADLDPAPKGGGGGRDSRGLGGE